MRIEACLQSFSHSVKLIGDLPSITFSSGIAAFPEQGISADELLRAADKALYAAKAAGRGRAMLAE
jgi:two-component system, cell cycle response regulator